MAVRPDAGLLTATTTGDVLKQNLSHRTEGPPEVRERRSEKGDAGATHSGGNVPRGRVIAQEKLATAQQGGHFKEAEPT